jgi:hypothetical protein
MAKSEAGASETATPARRGSRKRGARRRRGAGRGTGSTGGRQNWAIARGANGITGGERAGGGDSNDAASTIVEALTGVGFLRPGVNTQHVHNLVELTLRGRM